MKLSDIHKAAQLADCHSTLKDMLKDIDYELVMTQMKEYFHPKLVIPDEYKHGVLEYLRARIEADMRDLGVKL